MCFAERKSLKNIGSLPIREQLSRTQQRTMDAELEKAQAQAMEMLLQQCVAAPGGSQMANSKLLVSLSSF